jgi:hypothetical protein
MNHYQKSCNFYLNKYLCKGNKFHLCEKWFSFVGAIRGERIGRYERPCLNFSETKQKVDFKIFIMKICLLVIGKTDEAYLQNGLEIFLKRIPHYISFELKIVPDLKNSKNLSEDQQKEKEGDLIIQQLTGFDDLFLLDEQGTEVSSRAWTLHPCPYYRHSCLGRSSPCRTTEGPACCDGDGSRGRRVQRGGKF